jgi:hypothetical protein
MSTAIPSGFSGTSGHCRTRRLVELSASCGVTARATDAAPKHSATTLALQIERVWQPNLQLYDIDQVWWQLARCTVERLLQCLRLPGVLRGKAVRTTIRNAKAACR